MKDIIKLHDRKFKIHDSRRENRRGCVGCCPAHKRGLRRQGDAAVRRRIERFVHVHERSDQENRVQHELSFVKLASYEGNLFVGLRQEPDRAERQHRRPPRDRGRGYRRYGREHRVHDLRPQGAETRESRSLHALFQTGVLPQADSDQVPRDGDRQ